MRKIFVSILFVLLVTSLYSQKHFSKQNFAEMYNLNSVNLHPVFQCFHSNDTVSTIFYQIDLSELKYMPNKDSVFEAQTMIHYEIYRNYKAKDLIDSGSVFFSDTDNYGKDNSSFGYFEVKLKADSKYLMLIEFTDINQDYKVRKLVDVDKTDNLNRQNFYIKGEDGLPYLQNYLPKFITYQLVSRNSKTAKLYVRVFKPNHKVAKPPMANPDKKNRIVKSDTLFSIAFEEGESKLNELSKQGYYHYYFDSSKYQGYTLFQFNQSYPYITTAMQMLMPLRYLTSRKEFKALYNSKDKKKAVDAFWVQISGSTERAKNMIKLYYNRVQNANICFTSDKEGWMTDRGMIYIIFGAPDIVYRDAGMETWKYGDHTSKSTMTFDFYRAENPFTSEDFILSRGIDYGHIWNNAIEIWRR